MSDTVSINTGMLARSKAGHDKNTVYVVLREEGDYCYLTDGRLRPLANPKKKNRKHIQPVRHPGEDIKRLLLEARDDAQIRKLLRQYRQNETSAIVEKL